MDCLFLVNKFDHVVYIDTDWGGDQDDRKDTTGFVFFLGNFAFTLSSKKQSIATLSTCEAEYVATSFGVSHALWFPNLLK